MNVPTLTGLMIGAGYFARHHAEAWRRIPNARIAAVADALPGRAEAFAQEFGIPRAYTSVEDMLDEQRADFVDIITRPETHLELTRIAAARGLHVICQKPMAPTMPDCRAMVDACDAAGVRLLIHENWRWQPWYREIRKLLDAGIIGTPAMFAFQWRTQDGRGAEPYAAQPYFRDMPRLLVYETLVHLLDTFRYLHGEFASIYCVNRRLNPKIAGEDQSLIALKFRDGVPGLIDGNRLSGPPDPGVAMGDMTIDGDMGRLRLSAHGNLWIQHAAETASGLPFRPPQTGYKGDSVFATQSHLIDALINNTPSESDGVDYLRTAAAVFACYESARTGDIIRLE
jgi:D-apiose dehydrogenase